MSRLIDADAILHTHKSETATIGKDWTIEDLATAIELAPTVDAIPVEWLKEHDNVDITDKDGNSYGRRRTTVAEALSIWQKEQEAQNG